MKQFTLVCFLLAPFLISAQITTEPGPDEYIRKKIEDIYIYGEASIVGEKIHSTKVLPVFYQNNLFKRVWKTEKLQSAVLKILKDADKDGFNREDYHYSKIVSLLESIESEGAQPTASFVDILLTDAFLSFSSHMLHGKVDPVDIHPEWNIQKKEGDPLLLLLQFISSGNVDAWYSVITPENQYYHALKKYLAEYVKLKDQAGWTTVNEGDALKKGISGERVVQLII
ncbi:MAG: hypothetical protein V2I47_03400, partial [Bacteroidales bacterium]|nr:hypothetical protein [Bacteroidales bacterium]